MYQSWINRDGYNFETNLDFIEVEPADIITFTKDNQTYSIRITNKDEDRGIIKFKGVANNGAVYSQVSVGETGLIVNKEIKTILDSLLIYLDIPILLDTDNDAGIYVGSGATDTNYTGSVLYSSDLESGNYSNLATFSTSITYGSTQTVLGNFTYGNITDNFNKVTVKLDYGTLASCTRDELLNFSNLAMIGNEIIQFKNATLIDTNTYLLTGLFRGKFGTEQYISSHLNGEQFILLSKDTLQRINKSISNYNQYKYYKNVSFGSSINSTSYDYKKQSCIGLMPYSVYNIESNRNTITGDWNCVFDTRIRGMGLLRDNADIIDPDNSTYKIEIWDSTFANKKRTIYTYTNSFTYTSADQIFDFGSNRTAVYAKIYKQSEQIGDGFAWQGQI
jgi:hypothetical protein